MSLAVWRRSLATGFRVFAAALREIFDESAYQRFLTRQGWEDSPRSYSEFLQEREALGRRPRPRCC